MSNNKRDVLKHKRTTSNKQLLTSPRDRKQEPSIMADVNKVGAEMSNLCVSGSSPNVFTAIRKTNATKNATKAKEYFNKFDLDRDGFLNVAEFDKFLSQLFSTKKESYTLSKKQAADIFKMIDENQDGKIDLKEFTECWHHWLSQILDPVSALVIVDVQNDFISGTMAISGCPAGQDGAAVVPIINKILEKAKFDIVVYSADWHPDNHISFIENVNQRKMHHSTKVTASNARKLDTVVFEGPPLVEQKLWPGHCVQGSWGSKLHEELKIVENAVYINKGTNPDIDSYSAFWDNNKMSQTDLVKELTSRGITDVYVCGLAYDICVGATTAHSVEHGFRTVLVEDGARGVDLDDMKAVRERLLKQGAAIINSDAVADMVNADDRRPDLGYQAALNFAMARKLAKQETKRPSVKEKDTSAREKTTQAKAKSK